MSDIILFLRHKSRFRERSTFVVMDKDTKQTKLYEHYLGFFLPEGILNFFELVWM